MGEDAESPTGARSERKRWMAVLPAIPGAKGRFGGSEAAFSISLWRAWLDISEEHAKLAACRATPTAAIDALSQRLYGEDSTASTDSAADGSEAYAALVAIVSAASAVDAFYGTVKPLISPPRSKAARERQILECLKLGFAIGDRAKRWLEDLDWLFAIRGNAVHHSEVWEQMTVVRETEETVVLGGRTTFDFSSASASRAAEIAQDIIHTCLQCPKPSTADWVQRRLGDPGMQPASREDERATSSEAH